MPWATHPPPPQSINWAKLEKRELESKFKPEVSCPRDIKNFDKLWTDQPAVDSPCGTPTASGAAGAEHHFRGFTYVAPCVLDQILAAAATNGAPANGAAAANGSAAVNGIAITANGSAAAAPAPPAPSVAAAVATAGATPKGASPLSRAGGDVVGTRVLGFAVASTPVQAATKA